MDIRRGFGAYLVTIQLKNIEKIKKVLRNTFSEPKYKKTNIIFLVIYTWTNKIILKRKI